MIFYVLFSYVLCLESTYMEKMIYLNEGERYKINLDSIFSEEKNENLYSFVQDRKGFILNTTNLILSSANGTYKMQPTKIIRQRQYLNMGDHQGYGQFGILDQHQQDHHRICYNDGDIIDLNQCIELDQDSPSYDFVFIARNTIAVSEMRLSDQRFSVTIYQNRTKVDEIYFYRQGFYQNIPKTIIEYCVFSNRNYLLFGIRELDSNIEFLEILSNFTLVNTQFTINKSLLPIKSSLQDIKGRQDKVYLVLSASNEQTLIISFIFNQSLQSQPWQSQPDYVLLKNFRALELGQNFVNGQYIETVLICQQDKYKVNTLSSNRNSLFSQLYIDIKHNAQVKYTLNYLIVLQDNLLIVTRLPKSSQRINKIEGQLLNIDVDFQNDVVIVFTHHRILTYYLKQATLSYSPIIKTAYQDSIKIQARASDYTNKQIVKVIFQVLEKKDNNLYIKNDLTQDIYYNAEYPGTQVLDDNIQFKLSGLNSSAQTIPLYGISGADVQVDLRVNSIVQIVKTNLFTHEIENVEISEKIIIQEQFLVTSIENHLAILFRQFDDFSFSAFLCRRAETKIPLNLIKANYVTNYKCIITEPFLQTQLELNQMTFFQFQQSGQESYKFSVLFSDGLVIKIYNGILFKEIKAEANERFMDMKVGTNKLFVYTINNKIFVYHFPQGELIYQIDLSQFGVIEGYLNRKLWVNQLKTNLLIIYYGNLLIIGRFTTAQYKFKQRIIIKSVADLSIISDEKFIVLVKDKEIFKLIQYSLDDGQLIMQRELDTHGYKITEARLINDFVKGVILVLAELNKSKALLAFGDTELERDSLIKVIRLQDDQIPVNIINVNHQQGLFIRSIHKKKNSSIIGMFYGVQPIEIKLLQVLHKFSEQLNLIYSFRSQFSLQHIDIMRKFYSENLFFDIIVKEPLNQIYYRNENQLKIQINPDSFYGQVRTIRLYKIPHNLNHQVELITRFKNQLPLLGVSDSSRCKLLVQFRKILCVGRDLIFLYRLNGTLIQQIKYNTTNFHTSPYWILNYNEQYALVQNNGQLILIIIKDDNIAVSKKNYQMYVSLYQSIFYQQWLVLYQQSYLRYYKFQPESNDEWLIEKYTGYQIIGIKILQYDPISQWIFYSIGDDNIYYFKSSLEGNDIIQDTNYSYNISVFLKSLNIFDMNAKVDFIKIITQQQQSFIFISTSNNDSNSKIFNLTIKFVTQEFQFNNMYLVDGPVQEIQMIDDYVLVQMKSLQYLYKNTNNQKFFIPYLSLESVDAKEFVGCYKNGSQIVHLYHNYYNQVYQSNIDDQMYIMIQEFQKYQFKNISILAENSLQQALIMFELIKYETNENYNVIALILLALIGIALLLFYLKRKIQINKLIK